MNRKGEILCYARRLRNIRWQGSSSGGSSSSRCSSNRIGLPADQARRKRRNTESELATRIVVSLLCALPSVPCDSDYLGAQTLTGREIVIGWG